MVKPAFLGVPQESDAKGHTATSLSKRTPPCCPYPPPACSASLHASKGCGWWPFPSAGAAGGFPHSHPYLGFSASSPRCGFAPWWQESSTQCIISPRPRAVKCSDSCERKTKGNWFLLAKGDKKKNWDRPLGSSVLGVKKGYGNILPYKIIGLGDLP